MGFLDPYAVNGVNVSAAQLRQAFYQAVKGETGVASATALKATGIVGSPGVLGIMAGVGSVAVQSRREAYQISNPAMDGDALINVPPAGGAPVSYEVILEITDPQYHGGVGDEAVTLRLVNTLAGLTKPYLWVASFTLATGAGFDATTPITDRRKIANERTHREVLSHTTAGIEQLPSAGRAKWPNKEWVVNVPEWATHVQVIAHFFGIYKPTGANVIGDLGVQIDGTQSTVVLFEVDATTGNTQHTMGATYKKNVSAKAGGTITVNTSGYRNAALGAGTADMRTSSHLVLDVEFTEEVL